MKTINIEKRDGRFEPIDHDKYWQHLNKAQEGYPNISMTDVADAAFATIVDGSKSSDIQNAMIKECSEKIYEDPNYQIPAARLLNQKLRKEVYGAYDPIPLLEAIKKNVANGLYDGEYLSKHYTDEELTVYGSYMDYGRDDEFVYGGLKSMYDTYLNKQYGKVLETPQEAYMLVALFAFAKYAEKYDKATRDKWVKIMYDSLSTHKISLPTPMLKQLRTAFRKFISCSLIPLGDSKETVANANKVILLLVAEGYGLGIGANDLRGLGADIDNGRVVHTGSFGILKGAEKNTKAFTQPSRDGSSTTYYSFFSMEVNSFMVLGNAKGTGDTRIRDMDHAIMFNDFFIERYGNNQDITLFYMNDVPDLNSYLGNYEEFKRRYEEYERTIPAERQVKIPAFKLLHTFLGERSLQSREYVGFADNVQEHSSFTVPLKQLNLCAEIATPSFPLHHDENIRRNITFKSPEARVEYYKLRNEAYYYMVEEDKMLTMQLRMRELYTFDTTNMVAVVDESKDYDYFTLDGLVNLGEVGVCILGGINMGRCSDDDLIVVAELLVRMEDELIDYIEYAVSYTEKAAKMRRTLGLGVSDVFHDLARNKLFYNTREGRQYIHDRMELISYSMIKTSIQLAEDFGPCQLISDTKYADGIFPVDTYKKTVDELVTHDNLGLDWVALKARAKKHGMRHSTLMANPPFGNSSIPSDSQPGYEPPRKLIAKKSGLPKVVPEYEEYGDYYTTSWGEDFNNVDYLKFVAVILKFYDQAGSTNEYNDLIKYVDKKIPKSELLRTFLVANYYGHKSMYYANLHSEEKEEEDMALTAGASVAEEVDEGPSCSGGGCTV